MSGFTRVTLVGSSARADVAVPEDETMEVLLPRLLDLIGEPSGPIARGRALRGRWLPLGSRMTGPRALPNPRLRPAGRSTRCSLPVPNPGRGLWLLSAGRVARARIIRTAVPNDATTRAVELVAGERPALPAQPPRELPPDPAPPPKELPA